MAEKPTTSVAQVVKKIEAGSQRVNQLATLLSQRITAFQGWLNQLSGRVQATLWVSAPPPNDDDPAKIFGLHFDRDGKRWALFNAYAYEPNEDREVDCEWTLLTDASVETKLYAITHFPELLLKIAELQVSTASKLEVANGEFDAFAEAIGLKLQKEDNGDVPF